MYHGSDVAIDFTTQRSMRRVHEAHRYYERIGGTLSTMAPAVEAEEWTQRYLPTGEQADR